MRGPGFVPLCGPPPGLFRIERWDCYVVSPMENQGGAFVTKRPHQNAAIFFDARRRSSANYFENRDIILVIDPSIQADLTHLLS